MAAPDDKAHQMVAQGALLLDVRTPGEFARGHVEGAVNIPLDQLTTQLGGLDPERAVVVYCRSGGRSARAAAMLRSGGVQTLHDMGGMAHWSGGFNPADYLIPVLLCLTLGLAPFSPEPHLVGKLRWLAGGATGMGATDWFDLMMHGAPYLWVTALLTRDGMQAMKG